MRPRFPIEVADPSGTIARNRPQPAPIIGGDENPLDNLGRLPGIGRFVVAEQLRERSIDADIVLEPMRRDSGPAVAVAAVLAMERDREALALVLAADHVIRKPDEFRAGLVKEYTEKKVQEFERLHKLPSRWGSKDYPGLIEYWKQETQRLLRETGLLAWW